MQRRLVMSSDEDSYSTESDEGEETEEEEEELEEKEEDDEDGDDDGSVRKRAKTNAPATLTAMHGSASLNFKVGYEQARKLSAGTAVHSDVVSIGNHLWRIDFYPHGTGKISGKYFSICLKHMSKSRSVTASVDAYLLNKQGHPSNRVTSQPHEFQINGEKKDQWEWNQAVGLKHLENYHVAEGHFTFVLTLTIIDDNSIPVPPSDIGIHLGGMLGCKDGADVSFTVECETFIAHRVVLATRSPVFRAELFGSMAEATTPSITLHDMKPATFKAMLRFIYMDALPADHDLPIEVLQDLLAASERYALDRLKFMCASKLWDNVSADTVAAILVCAETYGCVELKKKCFQYFTVEKNFRRAVFTSGYALLMQKFPSIIEELSNMLHP